MASDTNDTNEQLGQVLLTVFEYDHNGRRLGGSGGVCRAERRGDFVFLIEDDGGHGKTLAAFTLWKAL